MILDFQNSNIVPEWKENRLVFETEVPSGPNLVGARGVGKQKRFPRQESEAEVGPRSVSDTPGGASTAPTAPEHTTAPENAESDKIKKVVLRKTVDRTVDNLLNRENLTELILKVRNVLEQKENKDRLGTFITNHSPYDGDFSKWNKEFCEAFFLSELQNKNADQESMRIVAAIQYFLSDQFKDRKLFADKADKDTNRFLLVDGRLGGYTLSVLAEYWNLKYPKSETNPPLNYVALGPNLEANAKYKTAYGEAIEHLRRRSLSAPRTLRNLRGGQFSGEPAFVASSNVETQPMDQQQQISALTRALIPNEFHLGHLDQSFKNQEEDFTWLRKEKDKDISAWFWVNSFTKEKGSWPDLAYREYETLFNKDKEAGHPLSKETLAAWDRLWQALNDYRSQATDLHVALHSSYRKKVEALVSSYELPAGINWANLDPIELVESSGETPSTTTKNTAYRMQERKIESAALRDRTALSDFFKRYFKEEPKLLPKDWDTLRPYLKSEKSETELRQDFSSLGDTQMLNQIKEIITLNNMYRVYGETEKLKSDYGRERTALIAKLNDSYKEFYQNFKGNPNANLTASLLEKRDTLSGG
jgi:hypothetical protein